MGVSELLRRRAMVNARTLIAKLSTVKIVFMVSSSGYCAIHRLLIHSFSTYVFSGATECGAMAVMAVAWHSHSRRGVERGGRRESARPVAEDICRPAETHKND